MATITTTTTTVVTPVAGGPPQITVTTTTTSTPASGTAQPHSAAVAGSGTSARFKVRSPRVAGARTCVRVAAAAQLIPALGAQQDGFEAVLDATFEGMCTDADCPIPGLVVLAKRGEQLYHKAFGMADKEQGLPMGLDAQFRCFSMTKVFASTIAVMLQEQGALDLEAPVADYLPAFDRQFDVIFPDDEAGPKTVEYESFLTGKTHTLRYDTKPAEKKLLVKHCCAEATGIGYDMWTDFHQWLGLFGNEFGVAQALRKQAGNGYYSSNQIIGQDATLAEYCNAIAGAGVLACEPGTLSYGLGALVVGRVIEVAFAKKTGRTLLFSEIMREMLWGPLGMDSAAFYLNDDDERIAKVPQLYSAVLKDPADLGGPCDVLPISEIQPASAFPNTVTTDQYAGPRKCESGDTGACMTVADYAKFYEFLLAGGVTPSGERLLSTEGVRTLTHGEFDGLDRNTKIGQAFGLTGGAGQATFNYGWAKVAKTDAVPHCNYWSGYANNHGRVFVEDDSYLLIFPQFMASTKAGFLNGNKKVRDLGSEVFMSMWA